MKQILDIRIMIFLPFLIICSLVVVYVQQTHVLIAQLETQNMPESMKLEIINQVSKYRLVTYFVSVLITLIRITYVAVCFYIGGFFFDSFGKQKYKIYFNIALKADAILVGYTLLYAVSILIFGYEKALYIFQNTSLLCLFNLETIEPWMVIPIGTLNIFEVLYWFFLVALLLVVFRKSHKETMNFVISTYGTGLMLYILVMMFVVLYISQ